jgi:hypothetical protein
MIAIQIKGHVSVDGQLEFDIPANLPPGNVNITIEIPDALPEHSVELTHEEMADLLTFTPASGADVVAAGLTGVWQDKGITDSVAWVEEQRRKQQEARQWRQQS